MKKIHTHCQNTLINTHEKLLSKRVKTEIVFGSPSTGCKGSGVCKVVPYNAFVLTSKCPHATAWVSITKQRMLRIAFLKDSMTEQQIKIYFRWQLFQVFESVSMPLFVEKNLGASKELHIKSGVYPVKETTDELIVDFYFLDP